MKKILATWVLFAILAAMAGLTVAQEKSDAKRADPLQNPFANPLNDHDRPRVLIIGDSISIGYTTKVRRILGDTASIHRVKTNCQWSAFGDENIEKWIGNGNWDVVHFNFGLWDWYGWQQNIKASPESYAASLDSIVRKMRGKTNANLVFALTTPPCEGPESKVKLTVPIERAKSFNDAAITVMKKHGVAINDLYSVIGVHRSKYQRGPNDVHYNDQGRELLAAKVAKAITNAIGTSRAKPLTP